MIGLWFIFFYVLDTRSFLTIVEPKVGFPLEVKTNGFAD